jgi:hypothetical protein
LRRVNSPRLRICSSWGSERGRAGDANPRAACEKVLPAATASRIAGRTVKIAGANTYGVTTLCEYKDGEVVVLFLSYVPSVSAADFDELFVKTAIGARKPIAGVGDEAFAAVTTPGATETVVTVRKGKSVAVITPGGDPRTMKVTLTEAQKIELAKAAATKL